MFSNGKGGHDTPQLETPEFADLAAKVASGYFADAQYRVQAIPWARPAFCRRAGGQARRTAGGRSPAGRPNARHADRRLHRIDRSNGAYWTRSDILARLGEELVPDADQGIIELAKNAYDADASTCLVRLEAVNTGEGTIRICDDGFGMTADTIRNGWLVIGRSAKQQKVATEVYRRVPAGDKGLDDFLPPGWVARADEAKDRCGTEGREYSASTAQVSR